MTSGQPPVGNCHVLVSWYQNSFVGHFIPKSDRQHSHSELEVQQAILGDFRKEHIKDFLIVFLTSQCKCQQCLD